MTFDPVCVTVLKARGLVLKCFTVYKEHASQTPLPVSDSGIFPLNWSFCFFAEPDGDNQGLF